MCSFVDCILWWWFLFLWLIPALGGVGEVRLGRKLGEATRLCIHRFHLALRAVLISNAVWPKNAPFLGTSLSCNVVYPPRAERAAVDVHICVCLSSFSQACASPGLVICPGQCFHGLWLSVCNSPRAALWLGHHCCDPQLPVLRSSRPAPVPTHALLLWP